MTDDGLPAAQPVNFGTPIDTRTTSLIGYQSRGHCLVIADEETGIEVCASLQTAAKTLLVPVTNSDAIDRQATQDGLRVIKARPIELGGYCLLYTSPSPRDATLSRMPSSA